MVALPTRSKCATSKHDLKSKAKSSFVSLHFHSRQTFTWKRFIGTAFVHSHFPTLGQVHTYWCGCGRHQRPWRLCQSVRPRDQAQLRTKHFPKAPTLLKCSMQILCFPRTKKGTPRPFLSAKNESQSCPFSAKPNPYYG